MPLKKSLITRELFNFSGVTRRRAVVGITETIIMFTMHSRFLLPKEVPKIQGEVAAAAAVISL